MPLRVGYLCPGSLPSKRRLEDKELRCKCQWPGDRIVGGARQVVSTVIFPKRHSEKWSLRPLFHSAADVSGDSPRGTSVSQVVGLEYIEAVRFGDN